MTVKELIEKLQACDPAGIVMVQEWCAVRAVDSLVIAPDQSRNIPPHTVCVLKG